VRTGDAVETPISVVIPLFNKRGEIRRTILSVINQTVLPAEIIVVDDGSTDGSGVEAEAINSDLVKIVKQSNKGESAARNLGLAYAKSPFVAFLDADDLWKPNHLATLRRLIDENPNVTFCATAHEIIEAGKRLFPNSHMSSNQYGIVPDFLAAYALSPHIINSTTACVRRDVLLAIGGFPTKVRKGPDIITWLKLGLASESTFAFASEITAVYNRDASNRSVAVHDSETPGSVQFIVEMLCCRDLEPKKKVSLQRILRRLAIFLAGGARVEGNHAEARNIYRSIIDSRQFPLAIAVFLIAIAPRWVMVYLDMRLLEPLTSGEGVVAGSSAPPLVAGELQPAV
jgi:glycosyltransferase involved in cell wall biosynthesis